MGRSVESAESPKVMGDLGDFFALFLAETGCVDDGRGEGVVKDADGLGVAERVVVGESVLETSWEEALFSEDAIKERSTDGAVSKHLDGVEEFSFKVAEHMQEFHRGCFLCGDVCAQHSQTFPRPFIRRVVCWKENGESPPDFHFLCSFSVCLLLGRSSIERARKGRGKKGREGEGRRTEAFCCVLCFVG